MYNYKVTYYDEDGKLNIKAGVEETVKDITDKYGIYVIISLDISN